MGDRQYRNKLQCGVVHHSPLIFLSRFQVHQSVMLAKVSMQPPTLISEDPPHLYADGVILRERNSDIRRLLGKVMCFPFCFLRMLVIETYFFLISRPYGCRKFDCTGYTPPPPTDCQEPPSELQNQWRKPQSDLASHCRTVHTTWSTELDTFIRSLSIFEYSCANQLTILVYKKSMNY